MQRRLNLCLLLRHISRGLQRSNEATQSEINRPQHVLRKAVSISGAFDIGTYERSVMLAARDRASGFGCRTGGISGLERVLIVTAFLKAGTPNDIFIKKI